MSSFSYFPSISLNREFGPTGPANGRIGCQPYGSDRDWKIVTVCLEKWQSDLWVQLGKQWVSVTQKQCSDYCGDRRRFSQTCTTQRKQMLRMDAYPSAVQ